MARFRIEFTPFETPSGEPDWQLYAYADDELDASDLLEEATDEGRYLARATREPAQ